VWPGLLGVVLGLLCLGAFAAEEKAPSEYEIKAAFLFNFAKFVEWPEQALGKNEPLRIGILGKANFTADIEKTIEGKKIEAHPVVIEKYADAVPVKAPHILFIPNGKPSRRTLADLGDQPVLTVGETDGFCEAGGMINLIREGRKVRFEVNPKAAERHKLKMSSKLIVVSARLVETAAQP
jgi:hypothetical protein